jgi:hypothetical protein
VLSAASPSRLDKEVVLPGRALASYDEFYPVRVKADGNLILDVPRFMKAVAYFSSQPPSRAAGELIYLGKGNSISLQLNDGQKIKYAALLNNPIYAEYKNDHSQDPMQLYKNIVNGIGKTLNGTGVEIVLHDTRNPLKSIVAIQNPITGRRLGDATTNFGYQLLKSYTSLDEEGPSHISYPLLTKDGKKVKATTIPLYQNKVLVGFICLNIDISQLDGKNKEAEEAFINAFTTTSDKEKIDEIIAPGITRPETTDVVIRN